MIKKTLLLFLSFYAINLFAQKESFELSAELEKAVLEYMEKGNMPGLSLVVVHGEQQLIKSYGYADLDTKQEVTPHTLFELGSTSKAFTSLAVMLLEEQGKIDLDGMITQYIPEFRTTFEGTDVNITLRQLLHHTSGIPWSTISKIPPSEADDALERTIQTLIGQELKEKPGVKFEYATINYDVLALVVERVSGQPFEEFLQQYIIDHLALTYTTVGIPKRASDMSKGHKIGFFSPRPYKAPVYRGNYAAGYVISNANDMARWLKLQLGLEPSSLYDLMEKTHQRDKTVPLHNMSSYGGGWNIALDGSAIIYHGGQNPNYASFVAINPGKKLGVALLSNSNSTYLEILTDKLMKTLADQEAEDEWDPGDQGDRMFSSITIGIGTYALVVLGFLIWVIADIKSRNRIFKKPDLKVIYRFLLPSFYLAPVLLAIFLVPESVYGFNWEAMFIWTPISFSTLLIALTIGVGISYVGHGLTLLFPQVNKYKGKAPQILLVSILAGLANVLVIIMVTAFIGSEMEVQYAVFYFLVTILVYLVGRRFVQVSLIKYSRDLVYDLQIQLIKKILSTSYQRFERIERGRIYTSLNDDVNTIGLSSNIFVTLISSIITTIGAFVYLSFLAFWATMLVTFLIVSVGVLYYYVGKSTNPYFEQARDSRNDFMGLLNGLVDGYKELSIHRQKKVAFKGDIASSAAKFRDKNSTANIKFVNAFLVGESLLLVLLGATSIGISELFPGIALFTVLSFVIVMLYLIGPINGILGAVPGLLQLRIAWNRVQDFIKEIPANMNLDLLDEKPPEVSRFEISNVSYHYESDQSGHKGFGIGPINLTIEKGEILFIIGGNGSGKTTLSKLITGLYDPMEGEIKINGEQVKGALRGAYFSAVFNPFYLFKELYGIDADEMKGELDDYLKLLDLDHKVEVNDGKYNSINLSGGQQKRLALLQCYLEDSPIYLFDEWAADQDPTYRKYFYRTLLPEMKKRGKIVIAITHDDHYFDVADKIIKMDQGKMEDYEVAKYENESVITP